MPDDNKTVVTEQGASVQDDVIDTDKGVREALEGFNAPDDDKKKPAEDEKEPEKDVEKKDEVLDEKSEEELEPEEEEEDKDIKRGQEILDRESKRKEEEAEAEAEQARLDAEEAEKRKPDIAPYTAEDMRVFRNVVPDTIFPDEMNIDGMNINLKEFLEDTPEVKTISSIVSKSIIDTLIKNKYIPSYSVMEEKITELEEKLLNKRFIDRVTDRTHGVPKAAEIYKSSEFKTWHDKQPDKIQALFRSYEEKDHIRGFKRFMKDSGLSKADEKAANLDKKRAEKKKAVDAILTTTARSKKLATGSTASFGQSARDEALAGFNDDDED